MTESTQEAVQETSQDMPQEQPGADLTINDLNALKTIIDIASSRGAFKPSEMVAVGQTYTKLDTFLTTVAEQSKAGAQ